MEKRKKRNIIIISIVSTLCILLVIYFGMSIYFTNHFYYGSEINSISVSGKSVNEVEEQMPEELRLYTLKLEGRGGMQEEIRGEDINLLYNPDWEVKRLKDKQNPFRWIVSLFNKDDYKMTEELIYDTDLLKEQIDKLSCFDNSKLVEPKSPSFQYTDDGYVILNEVKGNKVNRDILYDEVIDKISKGEITLDLEIVNCYEEPKYNSSSQEVIDTKNMLNKYVGSKITYNIGGKEEILSGSTIKNWLIINENLEITFDEAKIRSYLEIFSNTYNTVGKSRNFTTSMGNSIQVSGGDYGWLIDSDEELQSLITVIKEGQTTNKEPIYSQTAKSHEGNDIGNSYVEIDMSNQHLWFYKDGSLIVEGDVVTGNISNNTSTPVGVYKLKYKQKDATLKGEGYSVPVSYWMPFNGGIGIHDAVWRGVFGGNIYRTGGSHGCINAPYTLANTIFNNIDEGTPVICFY